MILLFCSEHFPCFLLFCVLSTISFDMIPLNISTYWNSFIYFSVYLRSLILLFPPTVFIPPRALDPTILPLSSQWIPPFPCVIISIASSHSTWYPLLFYRVFPLSILLLFVCVTLQKCYMFLVRYGSILHIWIFLQLSAIFYSGNLVFITGTYWSNFPIPFISFYHECQWLLLPK